MKKLQTTHIALRLLVAVLMLNSCANNTQQPENVVTTAPSSVTDSVAFAKLLLNTYSWALGYGAQAGNFDYYENDSVYTGIDTTVLASNIKKIQTTGYFTQSFIDNFKIIAQKINNELKTGTTKYYKGDVPPYGSDGIPWCNCQDFEYNAWKSTKIVDYKVFGDSAVLHWSWPHQDKYEVRLRKEGNDWKVCYMEGFDIDNYFKQ